jgi:UDPglucose 6-dehydrogenase
MAVKSVGVVGCGFVGSAIAKGFQHFADVRAFDIDENKATHSLEDTIKSDVVFVCLPTPMKTVNGSEADLSIMEKFFSDVGELKGVKSIFVIKSTVPIGTTKSLNEKYPKLKIVHSPEFLTARTANIDFITPSRNIVGGYDKKSVEVVKSLYEERFPGVPAFSMTANESEMVKYVCNCFYATKVLFFNEMLLLAESEKLNWDNIMQGVLSSGWISHMHTNVPGHDGQRGVGGTCVLPDAEVLVNGEIKTIEEFYETFEEGMTIESVDVLKQVEDKFVTDVTCREIDEDIFVFETEHGVFECTGEHLMPIFRNGEELLVKASEVQKTDEFFVTRNINKGKTSSSESKNANKIPEIPNQHKN